MIQISIKKTSDNNRIGEFTFYKNLIYIGHDPTCDLYIEEVNINSNHIFLEIIDEKLICQLGRQTSFVNINKKRTTGHKYLRIGDIIKIGTTDIEIKFFQLQDETKYKDTLNLITDKITTNDKELLTILKEVQKSSI